MPDRTVLITGAARRVGAAIARHLAADGWKVIVHYNRSRPEAEQLAREIRAAGGVCDLVQADMGRREDVENSAAALCRAAWLRRMSDQQRLGLLLR